MIAPQPFFEPRGTPISIFQRLKGLSLLGYQVDLVTYPLGIDVYIPGVTIFRSLRIPFIKRVKIGPSWSKLLLDIFLFFKAFALLIINRYDVIHSHEEGSFAALFFSKIFKTPHLYDMHSCLPKQLENYKFGNIWPVIRLFEFIEFWVLKTSNVVLTIGTELDEYIIKRNGSINHIRIENRSVQGFISVDDSQVYKLQEKFNILNKLPIVYTGSFERYQGLDLLFHSAKLVLEKHPEVIFILVGGKREQVRFYEQSVRKLGIEDNFLFTGIVSLEESLMFQKIAEILLSPRTKGLSVPLKIYSYLSSGKPIVATKIIAHTQLLDDDMAIIVEPLPQAFSAGILQLIDDRELRTQIGQRAHDYAIEQFSQEGYLSKLETAYLSIKHSKPIREISLQKEGNIT